MAKLKQEIFAVGTWNNMSFTLEDLNSMVSSFNSLENFLKVPLKIGHNDEQPMTDGQPALGWVTQMEVIKNKIVATFDHVPDILMSAFEKKLYRSVSIELDFGVHHKGKEYDFVITAVALLGADMPAVNVLNDLGALLSRNSYLPQGGYTASRQASFSSINGNRKEEFSMDPKEIARLQSDNARLTQELATANAKFTTLEAQSKADKDEADKRIQALEDSQKKTQVDSAREVFTKMLEDAVKAKTITPGQRETFTKVLGIDDDDKVLTLEKDDVQALLPVDDDKGKGKKAMSRDDDDDDDGDEDPSQDLTQKVYENMNKTGEKSFSKALFSVMRQHPELARDYVDSNGEVQ